MAAIFTKIGGGGGGGGGGTPTGVALGRATFALAAGANNNINPGGGWPTNFGRLILTAPGGAATLNGLLAGTDGQWVFVFNADAVNQVTINSLNAASLAANQFQGQGGGLILPVFASAIIVYDGTLTKWLIK